MYWICFGDSAKGLLSCVKHELVSGLTDSQILSLEDDYSQGDISEPENECLRLDILTPWRDDPELGGDWLDKYVSCHFEALRRLDSVDEALIWCGTSPRDRCGLRYVMSRLSGRSVPVWLVETGEMHSESGVRIKYRGVGEADEATAKYFYGRSRQLCESERKKLADDWTFLQKENSKLRAVRDGVLCSVPEDFYDGIILDCVSENERIAAYAVGKSMNEIFERTGNAISDMQVFGRIRVLAEKGLIDIIHYGPSYRGMRIMKSGA